MPDSASSGLNVNRMLLTMACLVIIIAGIKAADQLFVPFLMALLVAIISAPILQACLKLRFPEWLALLIVVLILVGGAATIGLVFGSTIDDFQRAAKGADGYEAKVSNITTQTVSWLNNSKWLKDNGLTIPEGEILKYLDPSQAISLLGKTLNAFGGVLTNSFFILLTALFLLVELSHFPAKMRASLKDPEQSLVQLTEIAANVNRYLGIKTLTSLATGVFITIWLLFTGVDFPVLWGLVAFLLNYIPNIGSILAAIPAVLLGLVDGGISTAVWTVVGYFVANIVIGNFVEPRFMGRGLGLSTLVVFISLVFWGWVLGPVGMFLSVPLTVAVKVALEASDSTRWIAVLLGSEIPVIADNGETKTSAVASDVKPIEQASEQ